MFFKTSHVKASHFKASHYIPSVKQYRKLVRDQKRTQMTTLSSDKGVTMKAQVIEQFGGSKVFTLRELPLPRIESNQVLIQVHASSVNPVDIKIRSGVHRALAPDFPAILHGDVAGIVVQAGKEVKHIKEGDAVFGCAGGFKGTNGAIAEYMVADPQLLAHKPITLTMAQAAALPLVAITAWEALVDRAKLKSNQTILIHAAAGGVGHIAIQLAKSLGAQVFATASTSEKQQVAQRLGAIVIPYKDLSVTDYVQQYTEGKGFEVVLDTVGGNNLEKSFAACAMNGVVSAISTRVTCDLSPLHFKGLTLHVIFMPTPLLYGIGRKHHGEILKEIAMLVDAAKIKPLIDRVYNFSQINHAHDYFEKGEYIGKVALEQDLSTVTMQGL